MISNGVNWTFSQPSSPFGEAKIWWLFEDTLLGASKTNHQENSHRCPILRQSQHLRSCSTSKLCAATGQMRKALCHIQTIGSRAKSFMSILVAGIPRESSLTKNHHGTPWYRRECYLQCWAGTQKAPTFMSRAEACCPSTSS